MNKIKHMGLLALALLSFAGCEEGTAVTETPQKKEVLIFSAAGDITGKLDEFRLALGDSLNTTPNETSGRREVNWDGVPPAFTNNNTFPFDFFNATDAALPAGRKRGLVLKSNGTEFRISDNDFADIDPLYDARFDDFSPLRTFITVNSTVTEVTFKVPGTNQDAYVRGFGAIFSGVDLENSTTIEFYEGNKSLGIYPVKPKAYSSSISLLGVHFPEDKVTMVKITSGNTKLAAGVQDNQYTDLVVMDDFLYNEPFAVQ